MPSPTPTVQAFPSNAPKDPTPTSPPIKLRLVSDPSKKTPPPEVASLCTNCLSTKSPLWRRGQHGEVLCNACGLYWSHHGSCRPLPGKVSNDSGGDDAATLPVTTTTARKKTTKRHKQGSLKANPPTRTALLPVDRSIENVAQAKYVDLPRQPRLRPALAPRPVNVLPHNGPADSKEEVSFIMHGFRMLFPGDHVAVRGADSLVYFAILADFCIDQRSREKRCKLVWLLPKAEHSHRICFDCDLITPEMFTIGPAHEQWEPMAAVVDVFYSPYSLGVLSARSLRSGAFLSELGAAHLLCDLH